MTGGAGAVTPTADGGFAMAGQPSRIWIVRVDAAGQIVWQRGPG